MYNLMISILTVVTFLSYAKAEDSATQKIKNAAHDTKATVKDEWKKNKPKIKAAFKDVGHSVADGTKKVVKDLKQGSSEK